MKHHRFEDIYEQLHRRVLALGFQMTGDSTLAEDVLQETFLLVHRFLRAFRGESDVSTWVYRIAIRVAIRLRSKQSRHRAVSEHDDAFRHTAKGQVSSVEHREDTERLYKALSMLSEEHRTVISLLVIREISTKQIAETLEISEGTVWSRAHHARKELRAHLEESSQALVCDR